MQKELGDQHHRQKARAGKSARNRMGWRRRLGNRLAVPARELLPHVLDDLPSPRLAFQGLRHHLAELAQPNAAALAAGARRRFDDPLNRQIVRQWLARRPRSAGTLFLGGLRCRHLGLGLYFGLRLLEVLDGELELLNKLLAAFG